MQILLFQYTQAILNIEFYFIITQLCQISNVPKYLSRTYMGDEYDTYISKNECSGAVIIIIIQTVKLYPFTKYQTIKNWTPSTFLSMISVQYVTNVELVDRFSTPMRLQKTKSQFVQISSLTFGLVRFALCGFNT